MNYSKSKMILRIHCEKPIQNQLFKSKMILRIYWGKHIQNYILFFITLRQNQLSSIQRKPFKIENDFIQSIKTLYKIIYDFIHISRQKK